jgi:hypothetical protein
MTKRRVNLREPNRLDFDNPNARPRKFGNKIYHEYSVQEKLSDARRIAERLREHGQLARIVEIERGHLYPWIAGGESLHKKNYVVYSKFVSYKERK